MTFDDAHYIHSLVQPEEPPSRIAAANVVLEVIGRFFESSKHRKCRNVEEASDTLKSALRIELQTENYLNGAVLCWGTEMFNPNPRFVKLIWRALQTEPRLLIFGAGACSKSFTVLVFRLLDWERDPQFTTVKLVSTTAGHARAQSFSTLVQLHRQSAIPLSGYIRQGFIGLDKDDKRSSIAEVAIPPGDDGKARLQGFHPLPRPYPHDSFGTLTRVRGVFDEAEGIPAGLWQGEANMMLSADEAMHVSICAMWNPARRDSIVAQKVEPIRGWANFDERIEEYKSKAGYHVIRLDGRRCENVVEKREIYPGLLTYDGFRKLEAKGGPEFDTFGKGVYPTDTAAFNIISPVSLYGSRGTFIWGKIPTPLGTLDMAEEGRDKAIFTAAKYGMAIGFEREGKKRKMFDIPRWCIQIEQQFPLQKQNTIMMGAEAIRMCRMLRATPEWFALDCTNSVTLRDWLTLKWGPVLGIKWGEAATEKPILEEDAEKASDLYDNVKTEMWFAAGAWAEFGYLAFSPHMDTSRLFAQLSGMRYKPISKTKKRCEDTKEFKKRYNGDSPDEAASCVMTVHLVRSHSILDQQPAMSPEDKVDLDADFLRDKPEIEYTEESEVEPMEWV